MSSDSWVDDERNLLHGGQPSGESLVSVALGEVREVGWFAWQILRSVKAWPVLGLGALYALGNVQPAHAQGLDLPHGDGTTHLLDTALHMQHMPDSGVLAISSPPNHNTLLLDDEMSALAAPYSVKEYKGTARDVPPDFLAIEKAYTNYFPELDAMQFQEITKITAPSGETIFVINYDQTYDFDGQRFSNIYEYMKQLGKQGLRIPYPPLGEIAVNGEYSSDDMVIGIVPASIAKYPTHTNTFRIELEPITASVSYIAAAPDDGKAGPYDQFFATELNKTEAMVLCEVAQNSFSVAAVSSTPQTNEAKFNAHRIAREVFNNSLARALSASGKYSWDEYAARQAGMSLTNPITGLSYPAITFNRDQFESMPRFRGFLSGVINGSGKHTIFSP